MKMIECDALDGSTIVRIGLMKMDKSNKIMYYHELISLKKSKKSIRTR